MTFLRLFRSVQAGPAIGMLTVRRSLQNGYHTS